MEVRRTVPVLMAAVAAACICVFAVGGCDRFLHKVAVDHVPEVPYPTCPGPAAPDEVLHTGSLRAGPFMHDPNVVERYTVTRRGCFTAVRVRQEWPMGTADVEALFDAQGLPLRIWKRMTNPQVPNPMASAEYSMYELRTLPVALTMRVGSGPRTFSLMKGPRPTAVVGPGRGVLSMWIRRANLPVGLVRHESVLDFRGIPVIDDIAIRRAPDEFVPDLGRKVRVYSIFGRESVFTDDHGWVIADLAGLRPADKVKAPPPPPIPEFAPIDPVGTP